MGILEKICGCVFHYKFKYFTTVIGYLTCKEWKIQAKSNIYVWQHSNAIKCQFKWNSCFKKDLDKIQWQILLVNSIMVIGGDHFMTNCKI